MPSGAEPLQDVRASLQLLEVWRAEFGSGGQLAQAGVEGCVRLKLAPYGLARARFRLRPAPSSLVNACLRAALLNAQYAERRALGAGESGDAGFSAGIARAPVGCAYLKYRCAGERWPLRLGSLVPPVCTLMFSLISAQLQLFHG